MLKIENGKDLISLGFTPAKWFGKAIEKGTFDSLEAIEAFAESLKPKTIPLRKNPHLYQINLDRGEEGSFERQNYDAVVATMDVLMKTPTLLGGAVMPDACPAGGLGTIPVGGVVAAENAIHPGFHSADICCSLMATPLRNADPKVVLDIATKVTHFGYGENPLRPNVTWTMEQNNEISIWDNPILKGHRLYEKMRNGLMTQGDGNHFLFVGVRESTGETMLVTHHGSRAFGAAIYKIGMYLAKKHTSKLSPDTPAMNSWIPYDTEDGKNYWKALETVRRWTKLNHHLIHDRIAAELGVGYDKADRIWNPHNFVFKRNDVFYHAKGATPMSEEFVPDGNNGLRLIPMNMREPILIAKQHEDVDDTGMGFAPHGAGRLMSRTQFEKLNQGKREIVIFQEETKGIDCRFYSGFMDMSELPSAYKDAAEVERQIKKYKLAKIVDRIQPYGTIMAGKQIKLNS